LPAPGKYSQIISGFLIFTGDPSSSLPRNYKGQGIVVNAVNRFKMLMDEKIDLIIHDVARIVIPNGVQIQNAQFGDREDFENYINEYLHND